MMKRLVSTMMAGLVAFLPLTLAAANARGAGCSA